MTKKRKQTLLKLLAVLLLGFALGVWAAWPSPRARAHAVRDAVRDMNADTDAWLADLERDLAEPSGAGRER